MKGGTLGQPDGKMEVRKEEGMQERIIWTYIKIGMCTG